MGICSSCLGRGQRDDYEEISGRDDERLLFDDPNAIIGYGAFDQHPMQEDVETQREMESLQRVVAKTAHNMVDIFEIAPQDPMTLAHGHPAPFAYAGQGARVARYQHLAARLSSGDNTDAAANSSVVGPAAAPVAVDWISTDDEDDYDYVMMDTSGADTQTLSLQLPDRPLVGTFADAAAAMAREG